MKTAIFDLENWREIGVTLAKNKTRTFLTAFGIFWGTAMLAMLLGGAQGLECMMRNNFAGFASNTAVIFPSRRTISYEGFNKGSSWSATQSDIDAIEANVRGIKAIAPLLSSWQINAVNGDKSTTLTVKGESPDNMEVYLPIIHSGRYINASDVKGERKVAVLGKKVAGQLYPGIDPIGRYVQLDGISYLIVGVASQQSDVSFNGELDESVVVPSSTLRKAFGYGDDVDGMLLLVDDDIAPSQVLPQVKRILAKRHKIDPRDDAAMGVWDLSEQFKMVDNVFIGISLLALFVGFGSLLAGIIGIGNIMWVIVKERTQEIGIRRAIGATPADIVTQILSEGVVLTLVAGVAGICFAAGALQVAEVLTVNDRGQVSHFQLAFASAMGIVWTFVLLGTVAGLIPAIKSMKIKPVEAMRDK